MTASALLDDGSSDSDGGGVAINGDLKINQDYARRFDYNKKREELQRLEDKYGKTTKKRKRSSEDDESQEKSDIESSSESEDEDDEGALATEALDSEILATLSAIRSKDPKVYDSSAKFYTQLDDAEETTTSQQEKPMYLRDYHRENLLNGVNGLDREQTDRPKTYAEEQADLKASVVKEIHAAAASDDDDEAQGSEDDFMKAKVRPKKEEKTSTVAPLDVKNADRDPETFLSNFMSSRAWAAHERTQPQPFESDDEEEDKKAEEFEEAYNFRFEDPSKANEKLMSHARDVASKYSVRREEQNPRQKRRETEREKKEAAKRELTEEKARLRKLRIEEMEERIKRIKHAAGIGGRTLNDKDWKKFLEQDWDDSQWDGEMARHFGEEYYAAEDALSDAEEVNEGTKSNKKPKKPKWDDDIDIKDLVPDFRDNEGDNHPNFTLSDPEEGEEGSSEPVPKPTTKQEKQAQKRAERLDRTKIEQLVDHQLDLEAPFLASSSTAKETVGPFRYRETSPLSYGLTARDILMADDSQLNQFAGLKKLASFRDPQKKSKDKKKLGKKARLRMWRKETFGDENGPREEVVEEKIGGRAEVGGDVEREDKADDDDGMKVDIREGDKGKKRRRGKKRKTTAVEEA